MRDNVINLNSKNSSLLKVSPFEAGQVEDTNEKRLSIARKASEILAGLRSKINKLDFKLSDYAKELERCKSKLKNNHNEEYYYPSLNPTFYRYMLIILVLLEIPVNAACLDFLRLAELESYMVAILFGLLNVLIAKTTARVIRQTSFNKKELRTWLLTLIVNVVIVSLIFDLGELRGQLAEASNRDIDSSANLFIFLQMLFYVTGVFVAYFQLVNDFNNEKIVTRLNKLSSSLDEVWGNRVKLAEKYNKTLSNSIFEIKEQETKCVSGLMEYRNLNLMQRSTPGPEYWRNHIDHKVFIPIDLGHQIDAIPNEIQDLIAEEKK